MFSRICRPMFSAIIGDGWPEVRESDNCNNHDYKGVMFHRWLLFSDWG